MPKAPPPPKTKKAQHEDLLADAQQRINTANETARRLIPRRDRLVRLLVNEGYGVRALATRIGTDPSTISRICQKHPKITPSNKGWPGGNGSHACH